MILVGIDYSMTSPAVCIFDGSEFSLQSCQIHFISQKAEQIGVFHDRIHGHPYPTYSTDIERFYKLAHWAQGLIPAGSKVFLEDYAYAAAGRVFHIAENTALLKFSLWTNGIPYEVLAPTTIKKFATGSGRANKDQMYEPWIKETGIDLRSSLTPKKKSIESPVSDVVDSFFIAKMGYSMTRS